MVFTPLSEWESRFLYKKGVKPPFVKVKVVKKTDPDYEDTVYNLQRVGLLKHGPGDIGLEQGMLLHESLGPFANLPTSIPSLATNGMGIGKNDIVNFIRSRFKDDEDLFYSESDENELWICYDDSNRRVTEVVVSATANLSKPALPKSYNDGITEYRGVIHIGEPVNRTIPIYLWPDTSQQNGHLFMCLTGKSDLVVLNIPEGYREGSRIWTEVSHKKFETSLIIHMLDWPEEELPGWVEYEPNGPSTFPDFKVSESSLFPRDTAIEITRIFDYQSRMIDKTWQAS